MKIFATAAAGIAAATLAGAPALAQQGPGGQSRFARADANKDGKITRAEFNAARNKFFAGMDRNKDGAVDRTEARAFVLARIQERRERMQKRRAERMKRVDPNGDGKITEAEFLARAKERFKRLDANKDGTLTPDEVGRRLGMRGRQMRRGMHRGMRGHMRHGMRRHMRHGGKRYGRRFGQRGRRFGGGHMFRRFDANRDGKITKAEFNAAGAFMFLRRDLNGDGVIEKAEARGFGMSRRGGRFGKRRHR